MMSYILNSFTKQYVYFKSECICVQKSDSTFPSHPLRGDETEVALTVYNLFSVPTFQAIG